MKHHNFTLKSEKKKNIAGDVGTVNDRHLQQLMYLTVQCMDE